MADSKVSALAAITSWANNDVLYVVSDPGGTPVSKKITVDNIFASVIAAAGIRSNSAIAVSVSRAAGNTNYTFQIDASAANCATGVKLTGAAAASGVDLTVLSSGTNENLTINAKGTGTVWLAPTSTGVVQIGVNAGPTVGTEKLHVNGDIRIEGTNKQFDIYAGATHRFTFADQGTAAVIGAIANVALNFVQNNGSAFYVDTSRRTGFGGLTTPNAVIHANNSVAVGHSTESGTGRLTLQTAREVVTLTGATTDTTFNLPSGAMLLGVSFNVDTTVVDSTGDDTWSAAFTGGSTTSLATAVAAAINTKANKMIVPEVASAATNVRFTPNGGVFSSGSIDVVAYYMALTSLANV